MDWSQLLYLSLLAVALGAGRPTNLVCGAMTFNLVATIIFADDPISVAVADLLTFILLIGKGRRANMVAFIFLAMQPIYVVGVYLGLSKSATYAPIDVLAFVQLAVIGGLDVGIGRLRRIRSRRHSSPSASAVLRGHVSLGQGGAS